MEAELRELAPRGLVPLELAPDDPWVARGYGQASIEPGTRPAVLVIDLQYAFTDPGFEFGGAAAACCPGAWAVTGACGVVEASGDTASTWGASGAGIS